MSSLESDEPPVSGDGGGCGVTYSPILYTNAPETLLLNTMVKNAESLERLEKVTTLVVDKPERSPRASRA